MAFFTSISAQIASEAEETKTSEGVDVLKIKALHMGSPAIPLWLYVDKDSDNAPFLKALADKIKDGTTARVLVSGVLQAVYAVKDEATKQITKPPKLIIYVGAARRLRADTNVDPEQAIVFGSGFAQVVTDFHDKSKRKPELLISSGTQDLTEDGKYSSRLQVIGDTKTKTNDVCLRVNDGQEIYFMANLFRSEGVMGDTSYDKIKASATFMEEGDRVKSKSNGRRNHTPNMSGQLSDTFEETETEDKSKSVNELAKMAGIALGDF